MHYDQPLPWYPNYGDHRHWKYWENYNWHPDSNDVRLDFGRWVCREWNSRHTGDQIVLKHKTHHWVYSPTCVSLPSVLISRCEQTERHEALVHPVGSQLLLVPPLFLLSM